CTRARLSTDGQLYTCLFAQQGYDLKSLVRGEASDADIARAIGAIWQRREDRYSEISTAETAKARKVEMSYIGGSRGWPRQLSARAQRERASRHVHGRGARRERRRRGDTDRGRASPHDLRRQAGAGDAHDARRRARGARDRVPAQPAPRRFDRADRL